MFLKKRKAAIKGALKVRGVSQKEVAKELQITESYLTRLIEGTRYSRKFEEWIKAVLGIDYTRFR